MFKYFDREFKYILGGLGKRFVRRTEKKMNTLFLSIIILEYTRILVEFLFDGDLEAALKDFHNTGKITGKDVIDEYLDTAKYILSKPLEETPRMAKVFWYIAMGEDVPSKNMRFVPKGSEGNDYDMLIWSFDQCVFCATATDEKDLIINKETLGNQMWGNQCAGIFESMMQTVQDYVGNNYEVKVKETKCFLKGDTKNEFQMSFIPRGVK